MKYFRDYRDDSYNRYDHKETKASAFNILCAINQSDEHFHEEFLSGLISSFLQSQLCFEVEYLHFRDKQFSLFRGVVGQGRKECTINFSTEIRRLTLGMSAALYMPEFINMPFLHIKKLIPLLSVEWFPTQVEVTGEKKKL